MIRKMKLFVLVSVLCALFMAPAASFAEKKSNLKEAEGKTYYTAVNIWYEDPAQIMSTNYHRGQLLPINTQVKIGAIRKTGITFTDDNNITYTIQIVRKHTTSPVDGVFKNYLSESKVNLGRFSGDERKNIEAGTIAVGMSRDAVLAAYGYPPAHMTPSLEGNQWKYWKDRFRNFFVFFKDGKVVRMGDE